MVLVATCDVRVPSSDITCGSETADVPVASGELRRLGDLVSVVPELRAQRRIPPPLWLVRFVLRRTSPASFSSLMAGRAVTTAQTSKIEKKLPFGTTGNRNL